jgi:methylamine---corrinoid protein Co-methyltransferase
MTIKKFVEILARAHSGPICSVEEWDTVRIPNAVKAKLKKYDLYKKFDPENPVNTDDELADRFFKAGFELAHELGVYCVNTERIINVSEEELLDVVNHAPKQLKLGFGKDEILMRCRKPEDGIEPIVIAPLGIVVAEEDWVPLHVGIASVKEIDIMQGGSLETLFGQPLRGGTPFETLAGRYQAQLHKEALWQAGRPGMPASAVISSTTAYGQLGGFGTPGGFSVEKDAGIVLAPSEMKTSYDALHKVAYHIGMNAVQYGAASPMIGGFAGPPEGAVLTGIAWSVIQYAIHFISYGTASGMDMRVNANTNRAGIWTLSMFNQALSRNTDLLVQGLSNQLGGPMTEMLLWESAAILTALSSSGVSACLMPRSAGGKYANHLSPLECKFCAEVLKAGTGLTRTQANDIVKACLPQYEDKMRKPDIGVPFRECYDITTLAPVTEWKDMYDKVKSETRNLGIPFWN